MPVYKDKERGTWFVKFYSLADPITGKHSQVLKRGFKTKKEALRWEIEQKLSTQSKTSITFDDMLKMYLQSCDSSNTAVTMKTNWIHNHFPLYDQKIDSITRPMLIEWRNSLKDSGLATRTINRGIQYVKAVFTYAEQIYGIKNPAVVVKTFKLTKEDKEEQSVWTPEQFDKAMEYVTLPVYKALYTFLFWTGCRRGEALAICKEDITPDGYVHIHRAIKHYRNGFLPLKTDSSERTIRIDSVTLAQIRPYIDAADPFVFGTTQSLSITQVQRHFTKAINSSGMPPIRIHDLRHSHATWLINQGVNVVAISKRLGHASINQTLKTYSHLLEKTNDEMMEVIENFRK